MIPERETRTIKWVSSASARILEHAEDCGARFPIMLGNLRRKHGRDSRFEKLPRNFGRNLGRIFSVFRGVREKSLKILILPPRIFKTEKVYHTMIRSESLLAETTGEDSA